MHQHDRARGPGASAATPATAPVLQQRADAAAVPEREAPATAHGGPPEHGGTPDHAGAPVPATPGEPTTSAGLRPVWYHVGDDADRPAAEPVSPAEGADTARARAAGAQAGVPAPVDVRAAARASLAAGRSPSLWWVCTGLVVTVVIAWTLGASEGAFTLAVLLAVSAVARAVLPRGPVALTVRSRMWDTAVLLTLALGVGILSQVIPTR
jgi:hypothetical protein